VKQELRKKERLLNILKLNLKNLAIAPPKKTFHLKAEKAKVNLKILLPN